MPLGETMLKAFMKMFNIHYRTQLAIKEVTADSVVLSTGEVIKSSLTQLMTPFVGMDFVQHSPSLFATPNWYIPVEDSYRHKQLKNVWAAGLPCRLIYLLLARTYLLPLPKQAIHLMKRERSLLTIL